MDLHILYYIVTYIYFVYYILLCMHFTRITLPTICNTKLSNSGYDPGYTSRIIIPNNSVLVMCSNSIIIILIQYIHTII